MCLGRTSRSCSTSDLSCHLSPIIDVFTYSLCVEQIMNKGSIGSVVSLLIDTLFQGIPNRKQDVWNILSTQKYIQSISYYLNYGLILIKFLEPSWS